MSKANKPDTNEIAMKNFTKMVSENLIEQLAPLLAKIVALEKVNADLSAKLDAAEHRNIATDQKLTSIQESLHSAAENSLTHYVQLSTSIKTIETMIVSTPEKKRVTKPKTAAAAPAAEKAPAAPKKSAKLNKMAFFKKAYKEDPEFREKFESESLDKHISDNNLLKGKKTEEQRINFMANMTWNHIKMSEPALLAKMEKLYTIYVEDLVVSAPPKQVEKDPESSQEN